MSVYSLPSITEMIEFDSTTKNIGESTTDGAKQDLNHTPDNKQSLIDNKEHVSIDNAHTQSSTEFKECIGLEEHAIANKSEVHIANSNTIDVSVKQDALGVTYSDQRTSTHKLTNYTPWVPKVTKKKKPVLLPRRSHFSCHDNALKEAGYTTDELQRKKIERTERKQILQIKTLEARNNINNVGDVTFNLNEETTLPKMLVCEEQELTDDVFDSGLKSKLTRGSRKSDHSQTVEHKALTEYLKYVKENTNEYLQHLKCKQKSCETLSIRTLIKTAMVFQRGHHGVPYETPTVRASHTLNTRSADPGQWQMQHRQPHNKRLSRKDSSISKLFAEKEKDSKVDSDESKTDYEKVLFKAERWVKTVSTAQLMEARQQALREVEEEDTDVTQWWISLKKCNYIRRVNTSSVSD